MGPNLTSGQRSTDKELRVNDYNKITVLLTSVATRTTQIVTLVWGHGRMIREFTSSLRSDWHTACVSTSILSFAHHYFSLCGRGGPDPKTVHNLRLILKMMANMWSDTVSNCIYRQKYNYLPRLSFNHEVQSWFFYFYLRHPKFSILFLKIHMHYSFDDFGFWFQLKRNSCKTFDTIVPEQPVLFKFRPWWYMLAEPILSINTFNEWDGNIHWSFVFTRSFIHGLQHLSDECTVASVQCVHQLASGVYQRSDVVMSAMALRGAVYRNSVSTLRRRLVTVTNAIQRSLSNYFSIDEHIYGLTEEQKQVITHLYIFHHYQILSAEHCLGNRRDWYFGHCLSSEARNPTPFRRMDLFEISPF
jgi:hypothetical protein